jgi:outer membrane protein assembly factor BamB
VWPFHRPSDDAALAGGGPRLLLASFGRLFWWFPATGAHRVVHEGEGKYYGLAPAADDGPAEARIAVVSRPDQERDDVLLSIDAATGAVLRRLALASRDTHQMVRAGDVLYVTDTFRGRVLALSWPDGRLLRAYEAFTRENHVNSLLVEDGSLLVVCHNRGRSALARLDLATGAISERWEDVGEHSHDVLPFGDDLLVCDSRGGGLLRVARADRRARTLWSDPGHFTKGLVVEDGIAYFAVSKAAVREERFRVECDVVAFDVAAGRAVWRRPTPSRGLVNALATPRSLEAQRRRAAVRA